LPGAAHAELAEALRFQRIRLVADVVNVDAVFLPDLDNRA